MELINITFLLSETPQLLCQISLQSVLNKTLLHKMPETQPKLHFNYRSQPNPHNTRLDYSSLVRLISFRAWTQRQNSELTAETLHNWRFRFLPCFFFEKRLERDFLLHVRPVIYWSTAKEHKEQERRVPFFLNLINHWLDIQCPVSLKGPLKNYHFGDMNDTLMLSVDLTAASISYWI